ncbi:MAG: amino acid permease [Planctomycetes bacterium]|nr:amino acid permease [Planctomycetota bacterium]
MTQSVAEPEANSPRSESHLRQLTPLLVWAVVFCDIGTSLYYVPGILYRNEQVRDLAPLYVATAFIGFLFLASKYVEICWRNPDGGGVVSIANQAFSPILGCFGGLLICVDYFLTSAISAVSGMNYLASMFPGVEHHVVAFSIATLLLLAIVNTIGIRESAMLSLFMAAAAFLVTLLLIGVVLVYARGDQWVAVRDNVAQVGSVKPWKFLVGFSGAWLAFSGLESISQLSPAMRLPIQKTAKHGMRYVIATMLLTSPILTLFAISFLSPDVKFHDYERLMSELGGAFGGAWVKYAVVITGSALLLFAANTAIIGCYHVFLSLAENGFMPSAIALRNRRFGTPQVAILVATFIPILVILFSQGDVEFLGDLYAFGLLGAFVLSSSGLDVLRWRSKARGWRFWVGVMTTVMVVTAWVVNLHEKPNATLFGCGLVGTGLLMAVGTRRKWFSDWLYSFGWVKARTPDRIHAYEEKVEAKEGVEILSLAQAQAITPLFPSSTLIAMRSASPGLVSEAIAREKGKGGSAIYALYVEERTGLFVRAASWEPQSEGVDALRNAVKAAESEGVTLIPVWTISHNAVEGIVRAAEVLGVSGVMIGVSQRSGIYHLLRGHVLAGLTKRLPAGVRLLLYG